MTNVFLGAGICSRTICTITAEVLSNRLDLTRYGEACGPTCQECVLSDILVFASITIVAYSTLPVTIVCFPLFISDKIPTIDTLFTIPDILMLLPSSVLGYFVVPYPYT